MTPGWLVSPSAEPSPHIVRPSLGVTEDTLLPLLQLDLTQINHGHTDWPDHAVLLGYHAYTYEAADGNPWPTFWRNGAGDLDHNIPRSFFFEDPLLRDGDREQVVPGAAAITPVDDADEELWNSQIRFGPCYGLLRAAPIWLPSDMPTPADTDGTPMTFVGQFAAGEISNLMPSFTYWLYWSPRTRTFAQIDEHD